MGFARVLVTKELLAEFLKGHLCGPVQSSAPDDIEVIEVREDKYTPHGAVFVVKSESFPYETWWECEEPPLTRITITEIPIPDSELPPVEGDLVTEG